jgi:hypothetical protein
MRSRARALASLAWTTAVLVVIGVSCRDPTEVTLVVTTQDLCGKISATAIYVAKDTDSANVRVQSKSPEALTHACDGTNIGSLVLTPGSEGGAVVVIAGYGDKLPTDCYEGNYVNCVIARRTFSFRSHTPLRIPIELDVDCLNIPCNPGSTCDHGACKGSDVSCEDNGTCESVSGNDTVDAGPGGMLLPDGAPVPTPEAGTMSDASDASSVTDASDMDVVQSGNDSGVDAGQCTGANGPCCGTSVTVLSPSLVLFGCQPTKACAPDTCCIVNMLNNARSCVPGGAGTNACTTSATTGAFCCDSSDCADGNMCCNGDPSLVSCFHDAQSPTPGRCWPPPTPFDGGLKDAGAQCPAGAPCCAGGLLNHCDNGALNCGAKQCCVLGGAAQPSCQDAIGGTCVPNPPAMTGAACCDMSECSNGLQCCVSGGGDGGIACAIPVGTMPGHCL